MGGKSPGTQVQHTLSIGTKGTEFRRFLASKCGTVRAITKSARGFAPIAISQDKLPLYRGLFQFVHNARRRGKALLGALVGGLLA